MLSGVEYFMSLWVSCIWFFWRSIHLNPLPILSSQVAHLLRNSVLFVWVCGCPEEHVVANGQLLGVASHLPLVERQGLSFILLCCCVHNPQTSRGLPLLLELQMWVSTACISHGFWTLSSGHQALLQLVRLPIGPSCQCQVGHLFVTKL